MNWRNLMWRIEKGYSIINIVLWPLITVTAFFQGQIFLGMLSFVLTFFLIYSGVQAIQLDGTDYQFKGG